MQQEGLSLWWGKGRNNPSNEVALGTKRHKYLNDGRFEKSRVCACHSRWIRITEACLARPQISGTVTSQELGNMLPC